MKTILILVFIIPILTFSQKELYVNISFNEQMSSIFGAEYFATEQISLSASFMRYPEITTGMFTFNYAVLQKQGISLAPKAGIDYFLNPVIGVSIFAELVNNVYLGVNTGYIFNSINYYTMGLSVNLNKIFTKNYK